MTTARTADRATYGCPDWCETTDRHAAELAISHSEGDLSHETHIATVNGVSAAVAQYVAADGTTDGPTLMITSDDHLLEFTTEQCRRLALDLLRAADRLDDIQGVTR